MIRFHFYKFLEEEIDSGFGFLRGAVLFLLSVHCIICIWAYFGLSDHKGWLIDYSIDVFNAREAFKIYVLSTSWLVTTITTVGYGDMSPCTNREYWFTMLVELLGIVFFSFVLGTISTNLGRKVTVEGIIQERNDNAELWLRQLDKSGTQRLCKAEYDEIERELYTVNTKNVKAFFEPKGYPFFSFLPYQLRERVVESVFTDFIENFKDFFEETELGFRAAFLINMRYKSFLPTSIVINRGRSADGIYLITKGIINVQLEDFEIESLGFICPNCIFGDIPILLNINSGVYYTVGDFEEVQTMCIIMGNQKEYIRKDTWVVSKQFFNLVHSLRIEMERELERIMKRKGFTLKILLQHNARPLITD